MMASKLIRLVPIVRQTDSLFVEHDRRSSNGLLKAYGAVDRYATPRTACPDSSPAAVGTNAAEIDEAGHR